MAGPVEHAAVDINPGSTLRVFVNWSTMQPDCFDALGNKVNRWPERLTCQTPGPINYNAGHLQDNLDAIKPQLASGEVRILFDLYGTPTWAYLPGDSSTAPTGSPTVMPVSPDPIAQGWWQSFVKQFVLWYEARYGRAALAGIEVYNEEHTSAWWTDRVGPNADWYSIILCSAADGVRSADPAVPVIFGPIGGDATGTTFLNDAYQAHDDGAFPDIRNCMNSIGLHPYNWHKVGPNNFTYDPPDLVTGNFETGLSMIPAIACQNSDCGRPISITEFGYVLGAKLTSGGVVTQQVQADWDTQAYTLASQNSSVNMFLAFALFDVGDGHFGVCESPGVPRLAATAFKQLLSGDPNAIATC